MMHGSSPNSERWRPRYVNVSVRGGPRPSSPRWTLRLLAASVGSGVAGGVISATAPSMALLVLSTICAAAALVVYIAETRPPRLGRRRY